MARCLHLLMSLVLIQATFAGRHVLKLRVDDEVAVYQNGRAVLDTFTQEGSQWNVVNDLIVNGDVLLIKVYNSWGPGGILATLDNQEIAQNRWRCASMDDMNTWPDVQYSGVFKKDFDDSGWGSVEVITDIDFGYTSGFADNIKWVWPGDQSTTGAFVCRVLLGHVLKLRVDDEVAVYQNGRAVLDTFTHEGSQWNVVNHVIVTADVLVLKVWNGVGQGGILATLDDEEIERNRWRCVTMDEMNQNPDVQHPGIFSNVFDDSAWEPVEFVRTDYGSTEGFADDIHWLWPVDHSYEGELVCRLKIGHVLKLRVDDEVAVYENGRAVLDTFTQEGSQWNVVYDVIVHTNMFVLKIGNSVGPAGILATLDSNEIERNSWRCATMDDMNQSPNVRYPGVFSHNFDDSAWESVEFISTEYGHTEGFSDNIQWVWPGDNQYEGVMVCRLRLADIN